MEATQEMQSALACTRCGAKTSADAPDGLCSRCFLEGAIAAGPPPASADTERIAAALPRYELLQDEGDGLYRARDRETRRIVALHVVRTPIADFAARAGALKGLGHPHLPRVHEADEREGIRYVVSDYVEGRRLSEVRLQPREAVRVVGQICDALGYAWDRGVPIASLPADAIRIDAQGDARVARLALADGRRDLSALADAIHKALGGSAPPGHQAPGMAPEGAAAPGTAPPAPEAPPDPRPTRKAPAAGSGGSAVLAALAGGAVLITGFLPWAGFTTRDLQVWANGWETTIGRCPVWLLLVAGMGLGVLALLHVQRVLEIPWKVFAIGGGIGALVACLWICLFLAEDPPYGSLRMGPGAPLTLLVFIVMIVGGVRMRPPSPARGAPSRLRTRRRP